MCCIAQYVRDANADLFTPDSEFSPSPEMLIDEPAIADHFISADERMWMRVYLDGSCLHQDGRVTLRAPGLAREQLTLAA